MVEMATKLKQITQEVDKKVQEISKRPTNPFTSACTHITKSHFIPIDTKIIDPKMARKTKFAFISFGTFAPDDFKEDFIPLCGQCQKGIDTVTCRKESLSSSFRERRNCHIGLDIEACDRRLLKRGARPRAKSWRHYQNALSEVFDISEVDVVMVNELGIPASPTGPSAEFFRRIKSWARKTSSLIIAGSFHDARTKYNTGYIFTPESPSDGYVLHKQVSATDIGEYVSVPAKRQSVVVRAFGFRIGVIICIDLLDYSTVASLVGMRDTIDFILVPSHSEAESITSLGKVAKIVSQAMPGGVGIVNCLHGQTRSSSMYLFGDSLEPAVDKALTDGSGWLSIYEVDWQSFRTAKLRSPEIIPPALDWLFRFLTISRA